MKINLELDHAEYMTLRLALIDRVALESDDSRSAFREGRHDAAAEHKANADAASSLRQRLVQAWGAAQVEEARAAKAAAAAKES